MIEYIQQQLPIEENMLLQIVALEFRILMRNGMTHEQKVERMRNKIERHHNTLVLVALHQGNVVGFKIGYEEDEDTYYSWLGCVDEEYRKQGIASTLMQMQHTWCRQQGYSYVSTVSRNRSRDMIILNIRHGFNISGVFTDSSAELKIRFLKTL